MYYIIVNYICQYKEMIMKRDYTNPKWDKVYEGLLKDPSELSFSTLIHISIFSTLSIKNSIATFLQILRTHHLRVFACDVSNSFWERAGNRLDFAFFCAILK